MKKTMWITTEDERKLYVEYYKRDCPDTLLVIHGGPGESCITFHRFAEQLAETISVVLIDQRGVLRSEPEKEPEKLTMNQIIRDFEVIRQKLNIPIWSILGHSFGGRIAAEYAAQFPEHVTHVILENPVLHIEKSLYSLLRHYQDVFHLAAGRREDAERLGKEAEKLLKHGTVHEIMMFAARMSPWYRCICFGNYGMTKEDQELFSYPGFSKEAIASCSYVMEQVLCDSELWKDGYKLLERCHMPILLLHDSGDPLLGEDELEWFRSHRARVETFESGHYIHLKDTEQMTALIIRFLEDS